MQTEILATIGPASIDHLQAMHNRGLSGIRINSSHGNFDFHRRVIERWRDISSSGYIVYDLKGPKIRIGDLPAPLPLRAGMNVTLRPDLAMTGESGFPGIRDFESGIPVTFGRLDRYVEPGHRLYVDDGYIGLQVEAVKAGKIHCKVLFGDVLRSRKGLNYPDTDIDFPYTMPYDVKYLQFALSYKVDFIADSFTRDGDDVLELRQRMKGSGVKIISKIENPQGVKRFDQILDQTDAIMIARGDLGVEVEAWKLPELQKNMIAKCNSAEKTVITATQMLESMIDNPVPSRADVSDIANAMYDGTDVLMLSGETSVGKYPIECVEMMKKIGDYVEQTERFKTNKTRFSGLQGITNRPFLDTD